MAVGLFVLDTHPDKLRIFVGGGVNEESIKRALRAACYKRRSMVRNDCATWLRYLLRELAKLSKHVSCETGITRPSQGFEVTIANTRDAVHLRIYDIDKEKRSIESGELFEPVIFNGSFFAFLGNSEATITRGRGGNRMRRSARLAWFREQYKKKHGYFPHEETPDSPKRYSPLQAKLNKQHLTTRRKVRRIKEAAVSRKKRKALIKKLGVSFGKVNRRDYFETPPDNVGSDD